MSNRKRVQVTLTEEQYKFMEQDMKKKNIKKQTYYFQGLLDEQRNRSLEGIEHILANTRETNKLVKVLLEIANYQLTGKAVFIPTSVKKSEVMIEAEQTVKESIMRLREIKLSKKNNI